MEPFSNFGFVCDDHAPKPDPKYFNLPIESFIGHFVKLGFKTKDPKHSQEHMWVKVIGKAENKEEELRGELYNDPIFTDEWECGDWLEFKRTEIENFEHSSKN